MRISKEITDDFKKGIVTAEVLGAVIYSMNKRAKNYRDKEREYREYGLHNRYFVDKYDNEGKAREKKEEYYGMKEELLDYVSPCEVHRTTRVRWYGDEEFYVEEFFKYYEVGGYSFHTPIEKEELKKYTDLSVRDLEDFETCGEDVSELLSVQFCKKVLNALRTGKVELINK